MKLKKQVGEKFREGIYDRMNSSVKQRRTSINKVAATIEEEYIEKSVSEDRVQAEDFTARLGDESRENLNST